MENVCRKCELFLRYLWRGKRLKKIALLVVNFLAALQVSHWSDGFNLEVVELNRVNPSCCLPFLTLVPRLATVEDMGDCWVLEEMLQDTRCGSATSYIVKHQRFLQDPFTKLFSLSLVQVTLNEINVKLWIANDAKVQLRSCCEGSSITGCSGSTRPIAVSVRVELVWDNFCSSQQWKQ